MTTTRSRRTLATVHLLYEDRPGCPTRHHNTDGAYRMGCICPEAAEDRRLANKRRRIGHGPARSYNAVGTARRIGALMALGHRAADIADELRTAPEYVREVARGKRHTVLAVTHTAVRALYERWSGMPGRSDVTRERARNAGYAPPLAWEGIDMDDPDAEPNLGGVGDDIVDVVAIRRVLAGELPFAALREGEKVALLRDHLAGWGLNRTMALLRMSASNVARWRAKAANEPNTEQTERQAA